MSKGMFKQGQKLWTFDFNAGQQTWSVYPVTIVRPTYQTSSGTYYNVVKEDGSPTSLRDDQLCKTQDAAVKALCKALANCRDAMHRSLDYHTKEIYRDWKAIDFCTDTIEELKAE